ncbi:MAG: hypothetical protein MUF59_06745 [Candidatus Krumholzibacteria bacterium]|jgi:hypothetical protein|nr:hypothetical protein [Candidatus Krumholzibacteria bacterium]
MEKKRADIDDLLATFSSFIKENYPENGLFRENLGALLEAKKGRLSPESYVDSLERNVVFLQELIMEGEVFLDEVLETMNEGECALEDGAGPPLEALEKRVKESVKGAKHAEILAGGVEGILGELALLKKEDAPGYVAKLEFNYSYLMTLRMLLFELFNVIAEIRKEYVIDRIDEAAPAHIMNHVEMTANYFLGNISVGEVVEEKGGVDPHKAST